MDQKISVTYMSLVIQNEFIVVSGDKFRQEIQKAKYYPTEFSYLIMHGVTRF